MWSCICVILCHPETANSSLTSSTGTTTIRTSTNRTPATMLRERTPSRRPRSAPVNLFTWASGLKARPYSTCKSCRILCPRRSPPSLSSTQEWPRRTCSRTPPRSSEWMLQAKPRGGDISRLILRTSLSTWNREPCPHPPHIAGGVSQRAAGRWRTAPTTLRSLPGSTRKSVTIRQIGLGSPVNRTSCWLRMLRTPARNTQSRCRVETPTSPMTCGMTMTRTTCLMSGN